MDKRLAQLTDWVQNNWSSTQSQQPAPLKLDSVSGDASFRRYFRAKSGTDQFIAVDAPPDKEDSRPFVEISQRWRQAGVHVPRVIAADLNLGFMLLEDFGDTQLLHHLESGEQENPYQDALSELLRLQLVDDPALPPYDDARLKTEMELFDQWFLQRCLEEDLSEWMPVLQTVYETLSSRARSQLQVPVHRDYHSRNLMPLAGGGLGVIDFQDALYGPLTYDLVSLLRDSYWDWPDAQVEQWVEGYRQALIKAGFDLPSQVDFIKDFDLMGMQRQLKVVGIFCRLWLRDGKEGYLKDIPRTFAYLQGAAKRYPEFSAFERLLEQLLPKVKKHPVLGVYFRDYH